METMTMTLLVTRRLLLKAAALAACVLSLPATAQ